MPVKLTFEGIRCFVTKQEAVLRPLTLLVGENSSGIVDAHAAGSFLAGKCAIVDWLFGSKGNPKLCTGGHLTRELDRVGALRRVLEELSRAGRLRTIPNEISAAGQAPAPPLSHKVM